MRLFFYGESVPDSNLSLPIADSEYPVPMAANPSPLTSAIGAGVPHETPEPAFSS